MRRAHVREMCKRRVRERDRAARAVAACARCPPRPLAPPALARAHTLKLVPRALSATLSPARSGRMNVH